MNRRHCLYPMLIALLLSGGWCMCAPVTPDNNSAFTSTRCITAISAASDGSLVVNTTGGTLERSAQGVWQRSSLPAAAQSSRKITWRGKQYEATVAGLRVFENNSWHNLGMPRSTGTHISALAVRNELLVCAVYGDGLYEFNGSSWTYLNTDLPGSAKEITALAAAGSMLRIGTSHNGIWEYDGKSWTQHLQNDEPADTNCQRIAYYRENLYISTLDQGLVVLTPQGWKNITSPEISSNWPRQMIEFKGSLYVLHGTGQIDRLDTDHWQKNVFADLPRKQASALAADNERLYVAQWGGWSEFDGASLAHHFNYLDLQGYAITTLLPDNGKLWIGTQRRGLAEYDKTTSTLIWHDERVGMPDDWIKNLTRSGNYLYAGTFTGGMDCFDGSKWKIISETHNAEITDTVEDGSGGAYFTTRKNGIWHRSANGSLSRVVNAILPADIEPQSLCATEAGLWIGSRTGLYCLRRVSSSQP